MTGRESVHRQARWLQLSPAAFVLAVSLEILFFRLSSRPLWHTDLWSHLAYGRLIVQERSLPETEPLMPLSTGVPFNDLAWLSQVLGYFVFRWEGVAAIQFLYAAVITLCLGLLAVRVADRTGAVWAAAVSALACAWLEWRQFLVVRPQLAGLGCFVLLFFILTRKRRSLKQGYWRWRTGLLVLMVFAAWSNLHGSFFAGLALLAAWTVGRAADVFRRTCCARALWHDPSIRSRAALTLGAAAAVLVNPYGWRIYEDVWTIAANPNLDDLAEWWPLTISMRDGMVAAVVALLLIVLYRVTPRRVSLVELLLLAGLGAAALRMSRMIVWWAPVAAYYVGIHAAASANRFRRHRRPFAVFGRSRESRAWPFAAIIGGCVVVFVSPLGAQVLRGRQIEVRKSLSAETPIDATEFLKKHPPVGQIFNAYEWGDYLLWAGPPGLKVFVATHAHLVPTSVWRDYLNVIGMKAGWQMILARYGVNTVVLDCQRQGDLVERLRCQSGWSIGYEDDRAAILFRCPPIDAPK